VIDHHTSSEAHDGAPAARGRIVAEAKNVSKKFGVTQALSDVSIQIPEGVIHGLVGRNGAGKSTLVALLTGLQAPDRGQVFLQSKPAPSLADRDKWRRLVACVYQKPTVVPALSVAENLVLGNLPLASRGLVRWGEMKRRARAALQEWGIDIDVNVEASRLNVNQRQLVEIIRAVLLGSRFIILDEPTAGLGARDIALLFDRVRTLQSNGVSFLYISHHLEEVFSLCHCVTVLRDGKVVASRDIKGLSRAELVSAMVGERKGVVTASGKGLLGGGSHAPLEAGAPVLEISGLSAEGHYRDVCLQVRAGECVGLAGHRGSGAVAIADTIAGLIPHQAGRILLRARPLRPNRPDEAIRAGVGYVPEDRYARGFVWCMSIADNVTLPVLDRLRRWGLLSLPKQRAEASRLASGLDMKIAGITQELRELSGGNQQKATIARAISSRPKLCVLVDPTAGIDIASKEAILAIIRGLREENAGLLLVSDDEEDLRVCDRIIVMFQGQTVKEIGSDWDARDLVMAMEGWAPDAGHEAVPRATGGI
jgi:simple sugar transport system ATP-binding protein